MLQLPAGGGVPQGSLPIWSTQSASGLPQLVIDNPAVAVELKPAVPAVAMIVLKAATAQALPPSLSVV